MKQRDYKVFETETLEGLKAAERHQQRLYNKYDTVKVVPVGLTRTAVWGESKELDAKERSLGVGGGKALAQSGGSIMAFNLGTGQEKHYTGLTPVQAVVAAAEQEKGNFDFTKYDYSKAKWSPGGGTVACGDWCVLVNKEAVLQQIRSSKRARPASRRKPRLTR